MPGQITIILLRFGNYRMSL